MRPVLGELLCEIGALLRDSELVQLPHYVRFLEHVDARNAAFSGRLPCGGFDVLPVVGRVRDGAQEELGVVAWEAMVEDWKGEAVEECVCEGEGAERGVVGGGG